MHNLPRHRHPCWSPPRRLLLLAVVGLAACTSNAPADTSAGGSSGPGGGAGTSAGAGGASGGAGGTSGTQDPPSPGAAPDAIQPLPVTTFAFYREGKLPDGKLIFHLWVRDVVTGAERLVSRLDDQLTGLRTTAGDRISISPDRRWIALSVAMGYEKEDLHLLGRTRMIWKVSVDGKQLVRVSGPITDWRAPCTPTLPESSNECSENMFCDRNSSKCTFDFWSESYEHPVWSPDGDTIFAHKGVTACDNVGCQKLNAFHSPLVVVNYAFSFANQPLSPGRRIPMPAGSPCSTSRPVLSPDGAKLAVQHSRCFARDSAGVLVAGSDGANPMEFPGRPCVHMQWRADGQAIYCAQDNNLFLLTLADRQVTPVLALGKTVRLDNFSFSTDGRWMVAELIDGTTGHLYLADLQATPLGATADLKQLTTIDIDYRPAF